MGVFLIFAILFVISLFFYVLVCVASEDKAKTIEYVFVQDESGFGRTNRKVTIKSKFWAFFEELHGDVMHYVLLGIVICCFVGLFIISTIAIITSTTRTVKYQQMEQQYIVLTERIEKDNSEYHLFYENITEYNNAVLEDRYWADNLWVNWYHNGKIRDLPLIGEEKGEEE